MIDLLPDVNRTSQINHCVWPVADELESLRQTMHGKEFTLSCGLHRGQNDVMATGGPCLSRNAAC